MLWTNRDRTLKSLMILPGLELGRKRDAKSHALPLLLPSFPLETNYCKLHTFKFIISLLSSANLELHEKLEGELRLEEARWG